MTSVKNEAAKQDYAKARPLGPSYTWLQTTGTTIEQTRRWWRGNLHRGFECGPDRRPSNLSRLGNAHFPHCEETMAQNIYDNPDFFALYSQLPRQVQGLGGAPE